MRTGTEACPYKTIAPSRAARTPSPPPREAPYHPLPKRGFPTGPYTDPTTPSSVTFAYNSITSIASGVNMRGPPSSTITWGPKTMKILSSCAALISTARDIPASTSKSARKP